MEALEAEIVASGRREFWARTQSGRGFNYRGRVTVVPDGELFRVRFDNRFTQHCHSARTAVRVAHSLA